MHPAPRHPDAPHLPPPPLPSHHPSHTPHLANTPQSSSWAAGWPRAALSSRSPTPKSAAPTSSAPARTTSSPTPKPTWAPARACTRRPSRPSGRPCSEQEKARYGFEHDYLRDLQGRIESCNRNIDTLQRRLEKTPDEVRQTNALLKSISDLGLDHRQRPARGRDPAEAGEVGRAYDEYYKVRHAQAAKADREKELKALSETSGPSGHQKLQVCDVCGAYLSRLDNDRRLADHFFGKMHLGFAQMRKAYDAFPKEMRGRPRPPMQMGGGDEDMGACRPARGGYGDGGWGRGPRGPEGRWWWGYRPRGGRRGW